MKASDFASHPIEELLPHVRPMLLLDRVTEITDEHCVCEVTVREDSEFCIDGQVGAWIGVEYMAQTVAALAGAEGLAAGAPVKLGLLLGTRSYESKVPAFAVGMTLRVQARRVFFDPQGFGVVDCAIRSHPSGEELAKAALTVFQVEDLLSYLQSQPR